MKRFVIKRDFEEDFSLSMREQKQHHKWLLNEKEKMFNLVWKKALKYAKENSRFVYKDKSIAKKGVFKCGHSFHIWLSDDRYWCKKARTETSEDIAIFEQIYEITVMSISELKLKLLKDSMSNNFIRCDKKAILKWIENIDDEGEVETIKGQLK